MCDCYSQFNNGTTVPPSGLAITPRHMISLRVRWHRRFVCRTSIRHPKTKTPRLLLRRLVACLPAYLVVSLIACLPWHLPAALLSSSACSTSTSHQHLSSSKCLARAGDVVKSPTARCSVPARPCFVPAGARHVPHKARVAFRGVACVVPNTRALHLRMVLVDEGVSRVRGPRARA